MVFGAAVAFFDIVVLSLFTHRFGKVNAEAGGADYGYLKQRRILLD
ncbi:MAG: hypothetical protein JW984_15825 [Deltaproteobacteria bacterium]|uniref:Uncharacterized protein n=1 Tax=Candidatus Zymogenus saltonus TaxID=2844893 RepID=A0A9D8PP64_9DELT|nr:hypothetical protein [Candidatus Zymogenus saltonus]